MEKRFLFILKMENLKAQLAKLVEEIPEPKVEKSEKVDKVGDSFLKPVSSAMDASIRDRVRKEIYLGLPASPWKNEILNLVDSPTPINPSSYAFLERQLERQEQSKLKEMKLVTEAVQLAKIGHKTRDIMKIMSISRWYVSHNFISPRQVKALEDYISIN